MNRPRGPLHAFIDESERSGSGYMICASTVVNGDMDAIKKALRQLRPPKSSRIHMKSAGRHHAMKIVKGVAELEAHSNLYVVKKSCTTREARDLSLAAAFEDLRTLGVREACIESCDQDAEDRKVIRDVLGADPGLQYKHLPAKDGDPLLWLPDVHAWAFGRGGTAMKTIKHRITVVQMP